MTGQDAVKILLILKAAYPNSYRGMSKEDAKATAIIWATQFADMPASVVMIAVNKLISTSQFPPSIGEVKKKIRGLYWEALQELPYQHGGIYPAKTEEIPPQKLEVLKMIVDVTKRFQTDERIEPSLDNLLSGYNDFLQAGEDKNLLDGK